MVTATKDMQLISHLMRRAGFGVGLPELESLAQNGYNETVNRLLKPTNVQEMTDDLIRRYHHEQSGMMGQNNPGAYWLYKMITTTDPLTEKMALFWHGIFATGYPKITQGKVLNDQIRMFRRYGTGNFRTLLLELSKDPAMIVWLDNHDNHDGAINENFGRELLELFSMGRGNYTEDDVKAAASAFTGWTHDQSIPRYPNGWWEFSFVFREDDHEYGEKTFLGRTGDLDGGDIVDEIVKQDATAHFIAENLHRFFVSDEPDEKAIDTIAQSYFDSDYEMKPILRNLFHMDEFKNAVYDRVRWPAEHVVNVVKIAGTLTDPYESGIKDLVGYSGMMGQQLLNPPTVEGWHTGREWIDSGFLIERVNYAVDVLGNPDTPGMRKIIERISDGRHSISPQDLVEACLYELGGVELEARTMDILLGELDSDEAIAVNNDFGLRICQIMELIVASREFQLS